jgi:hypothetical protein
MTAEIVTFQPGEQNILRFPATARERKSVDLHRMLDALVEIGQEEMVWTHFTAWLNYLKTSQNQPTESSEQVSTIIRPKPTGFLGSYTVKVFEDNLKPYLQTADEVECRAAAPHRRENPRQAGGEAVGCF